MKLTDVVKKVTEMAKVAAVCANCGQPKTGGHYYYKGGFRCKGTGKPFTLAGGGGAGTPTPGEEIAGGEELAPAAAAPTSVAPTPKFGTKAAGPSTISPGPDAIKAAIEKWLKSHNIENFKINEDGIIDVDGEARFDELRIGKFPTPVKFGTVTGDFIVSSAELTVLAGCPQHVGTSEFGGDFMCDYNDVTTLEGGPRTVGGSYSCTGCQDLESLNHMAEKIGRTIFAQNLPKVKNLQGIHKIIKQCGGVFDLTGTKLESHVLGLLMIKGLESVKMEPSGVADIINKHLKQPDRNAHDCQEDLIDAGFAAFAKL